MGAPAIETTAAAPQGVTAAKSAVDSVTTTSRIHVLRTTVAATASLLIAQGLSLPEPWWATISTVVVMQSSLGASWNICWRRFAGTAIGALVGATLGSLVGHDVWVFAAGVFGTGMFCFAVRLDRTAYRYTCITLAIVILASHTPNAWITAGHRFVEVSIGIAIGLVITWLWPEKNAHRHSDK
jgi:uncharacterized membrane protein YgaE (UPF0421/DUF939 family)